MKYKILLNTGYNMATVDEYSTSLELEELLAERAPLHVESGQSAIFAIPRIAESLETLAKKAAENYDEGVSDGALTHHVRELASLLAMVSRNHAGVLELVRVG